MKKISLVLILFISFFSITEEKEVVFQGKKFVITLPDGYCDQTDEIFGQIYLGFLKNNLNNMGGPQMTPVVVFSKCGQEFNFVGTNYPIGYVALQNVGFYLSQIDTNNLFAEAINDQSFVDDINKQTKKGLEKTFKDLGMRTKFKGVSFDDNGWLWGDEYVGILSTNNEGFVAGEVINEKVMMAVTVVNEFQVALYITNDQNSDVDYEVLTYELAINGERLAKKNR